MLAAPLIFLLLIYFSLNNKNAKCIPNSALGTFNHVQNDINMQVFTFKVLIGALVLW